ncbi:MAG: hypothetical protein Q9166_002133 [cf. Caloplaca sp. 2 TL-2023]
MLSYWQKHYGLNNEEPPDPEDPMALLGGVDLGTLSFQDGMMDNAPIITRAGLYVYLNALVGAELLYFVLNDAKHLGNVPSLVTELILVSFDILANAMYRAEPPRTITILRSFLVNKLPVFLGNYAAIIFSPLSIETCISQALLRVDPAAFPSFSQMFDFSSKNSMVSEARQDFLFACALHQLIPEGSIEGLLGDVPMQSLPASGRYVKNELVAQCTTNPAKIEELVGEVENMEGNAGEIAGALIENTRIKLDLSDLGVLDQTSFTSRYFKSACESRPLDMLAEHENDLLGGWIRGLFEAEGINDELMSMCKPAEFHLLVSTLFDQSIKACQARVLTLETLKGGFEYLLEPFLLPSLATGLVWFAHTLWSTTSSSPQIGALLPTLHTLLKPPSSMSQDSTAMHSAVLSIVAEPLDQALTHVQRQHQNRVDINPLLETLKPYMTHHRQKAAALSELESWAATPGNGLGTAMSNTIQGLMLWCFTNGNTSPANYTHRLLLHTQEILGAQATLKILVDQILKQVNDHGVNGQEVDTMFDIIVTMIAAPQPERHRLSLLDVLRTQYTEANEISKTDTTRASIIVRLHRQIETFSTTPTAMNAGNDINMDLNAAGQGMMLHDSQGMPATDIDDVLAHTEGQIASGDFMGGVALGGSIGL